MILPALPKVWPKWSVKGVVARGGFEVDIDWAEGQLTQLRVKSLLGNTAKIRYGNKTKEYDMEKGQVLVLDNLLNTSI